jgi:tetratricopeptide (TPR) repeat protein
MSLQGDLSTLDLTNLFQNLEGARKTGLLTVRGEGGDTELFFDEGKLASIAYAERPGLVDFLVAAGAVDPSSIEQAKKRRKRGKGMGAALVDAGALSAEQLAEFAAARLVDEACEVLAAGATKFEFAEVDGPSDAFDPDERALGLALAASPLLLESARRSDHWALIREHVPSDSTHYKVARTPQPPSDPKKASFLNEVLALLDGSRSVRDVVGRFPARRFEAYLLLADLAKSQAIRPIPAADLNARVLELARRDRKRAMALLERGLEQNPHHLALLSTKAILAEKMGDLEQASEALKLVVHLQLEGAGEEAARKTLERLKEIDEEDPFVWEKSFELALEEGRREDAVEDGRTLAGMLRKRGLSKKVVQVLERLSRLAEPGWEMAHELARARAEAGERDAAVKGLEAFAAARIRLESYPLACKAYEEILAIHPGRAKAKETLAELRSGALAQRKARWRRLRRRALLLFFACVVLPWFAWEALAARAYVEATRSIVHERLLESGRYAEARDRYGAVRRRYPGTTTAQFEVDPLIRELDLLSATPSAAAPR